MTNAAQKTPISLLQELCAQQGMTPDYKLMSVEGAVHAPTFMYRVQVNDVMATATGQSKKKAKHAAAKAVLERLLGQDGKFNEGFTSDGVMVNAETLNEVIAEAVAPPPPEESTEDNPVGKLQEHCMKERWQPPYYETENATGLPHEKIFTMMCFVDSFTTTGEGKSKRLAKRQAAAKMLERLNSMKKVSADEEEQAKANVNEDSTVTKNLAVIDDKDRLNPCVVNDGNSDSHKHSDNGDFTTTNIMIMSSIKVSKSDFAADNEKFGSSAVNKILDSTEPYSDSEKHSDNSEFHFSKYNDHEFSQGSKSDFAADNQKFESSAVNKILDSTESSNDKISDELITRISSVQVSESAVVDEKEKENPSVIDKNALLSKLKNCNIVKTDSVVKDPIQSSTA